MKKIIILQVILAFLLPSCEDAIQTTEQELVVDGWIDDGGFPVVMVSRTLPVTYRKTGIDEMKDCIVSTARVSVSDGDSTVVLTGRADMKYFPPYIYTTGKIRGKAGKKYTLDVRHKNSFITAETSIPEPLPLDTLRAEKVPGTDSSYVIKAAFRNNRDSNLAYMFFVMEEGKDKILSPSRIGSVSAASLNNGPVELAVSPATSLEQHFSPYFNHNRIHVKFCTMDSKSYEYWSDFQNLTSFSTNPIIPTNHSIRSNIRGGKGLWAGYGATTYHLDLKADSSAAE